MSNHREPEALAELKAVRDTVGLDAEITSVDSRTTEIETLINGTSSLHQHDYGVGKVADYKVSGSGDVHFKLVHRKEGQDNEKDD